MADKSSTKTAPAVNPLTGANPVNPPSQTANGPAPAPAPVKRKRTASKAPEGETKAQRFVRLANRRVPKALKTLSYVENLANAASYEYNSEQAAKIVTVLTHAVKRITDALAGNKTKTDQFSL